MNARFGVFGGLFGCKWVLQIHTELSKRRRNLSLIIKRCTGSLSITPNKIYATDKTKDMNKKILALVDIYSALVESSLSGTLYVPEPKAPNPNPYRHKQCKSCKLFKHCNINRYNDPKQHACTDYIKRK